MNNQTLDDANNQAAASLHVRSHQLVYPDERVVAFLAKNYPDRTGNGKKCALDIGCGSGRHLKLLLDYGFQAYGIDYSQAAIDVARNLVGQHSLLKELRVCDVADQPYPASQFETVICWGEIFLRPRKEMLEDLRVIRQMLCSRGRVVLNFRSKENWFFGKGAIVDGAETYLLDQSASPYAGMHYTFLNLGQAENLLKQAGFEIENSERVELWEGNCTKQHSWWVFWVRKPVA